MTDGDVDEVVVACAAGEHTRPREISCRVNGRRCLRECLVGQAVEAADRSVDATADALGGAAVAVIAQGCAVEEIEGRIEDVVAGDDE